MHTGKVVSGVVGVVMWCSVAGAQQSPAARAKANADARLEGVIEAKLEEQPELVGRGLDARVVGNQVTLTGAVKSEEDKALAARVSQVQGINQVNNQLEVQPEAQAGDTTAQPAAATSRGEQAVQQDARRALSDPKRVDPLVGTSPTERIPEREKMLRTMGIEDPKLKKQRDAAEQKAQKADQ